jgi:outer membrane receptor protein involved in Fe transport
VGSESFARQYFQLFPNASLSYKPSARHELALTFSRRLDRPSFEDLNPFQIYLNATTVRSGNAGLRPQTSYNAELTHTFLQKYSTSLSYSHTQNPIYGGLRPAGPADNLQIVYQPVNLTAEHYLGLTLTVPVAPCKGWAMDNTGVFFYGRLVGELAGTRLDRGRPALVLTSAHTLTLARDWTIDLSARYQSPGVYGYSAMRANGELTAGVQKSFWSHRATLKLNLTDVLYTTPFRATSTYDGYTEDYRIGRDTRVATLAFSCRFGNDKLPPVRRRADNAADEKSRVGGQ